MPKPTAKDDTWVRIERLPNNCTELEIVDYFGKYGQIQSLELTRNHDSKTPASICLIKYPDQFSSYAVLQGVHIFRQKFHLNVFIAVVYCFPQKSYFFKFF